MLNSLPSCALALSLFEEGDIAFFADLTKILKQTTLDQSPQENTLRMWEIADSLSQSHNISIGLMHVLRIGHGNHRDDVIAKAS